VTPPRLVLLAASVTIALMLSSCTGDDGDPACTTSSSDEGAAIVVADAPSIPRTVDALPPVDAACFDTILAEARGTPIVVNFWASWCEPCEREMPLLAEAARLHADEVQFLGVDILDTPEPARTFLARYDIPYPNVFDASGETRDGVGSLGQPVTVFYDAAGEVVAKVDGELSADELDQHLERIAA
jgi:cytochrome c biogenesis protein CcmG, thiol:disulfide interchange protein DsbE